MVHAMKTTIDPSGRLVIPKEIRHEAGLKPGMPLDVRWHDGRIEIEPVPLPVTLTKKGRLLVAVAKKEIPPLRTDLVERTRRTVRRDPVGAR